MPSSSALALIAAVVATAVALGWSWTANGQEAALVNGGFEAVENGAPQGWKRYGGTLESVGQAFAGEQAALLTATTRGTKWLYQAVSVEGGAWYEATAWGRIVSGEGEAFLRIAWYASGDASGRQLSTVTSARTGAGEWTAIEVGPAQAPEGARSAVLRLLAAPADGAVAVAFDNASFGAGEAPTPTAPPTPTATPAPAPTSTPTPTATPAPTEPPDAAAGAVPNVTPAPVPAEPPATAANDAPASVPATPAIGAALANGGFEAVADGAPQGWERYGGTLESAGQALAGERAALLTVTTRGTKWLYQAVMVEGGAWYEAAAWSRIVSGEGEAFLRIAWYASGDASGRQLSTATGERTGAGEWVALEVGPAQAPAGARSAVLRLVAAPAASAVAVAFDNASFGAGEALTPTPAPTSTPTPTATATPATAATPTAAAMPTATATPTAAATPAVTSTTTPTATATPATAATLTTATPAVASTTTRTATATAAASPPEPPPAVAAAPPPNPAASAPPDRVQPAAPFALRLSEVLADPAEAGVDGKYEWVELVNTADVTVSTAGWSLGDERAVDALPAVDVPPRGFVVVAGEAAALPADALVVRIPDGVIGNGLNNGGDAVRLLSPQGAVIDAMSFGGNDSVFASPPGAAGAGETLGAALEADGSGADGWSITLRPSPGAANEFPEPARAASPAGSGEQPAAGDAASAGASSTLTPLPTRFENESGSHAPWIALGAAVGAISFVIIVALRGGWRAGLGRLRRGR